MRILLVEDNSDHRELMRLALTEYDATWQVEGVVSGEEALCRLAEGEAYDVVFLDYSLPGRDGLEVLEEIRRGEAPPPVVMVTGRGDEQVAVWAMKGGAYDYVVKGEGYRQRLPVVAQRALEAQQLAVERKRAEEALRTSAKEWQTTFDSVSDAISIVNLEGIILRCNKAMANLLGRPFNEIIGHTCWELVHGTSEHIEGCPLVRVLETHRRESIVLPIGDRWFNAVADPIINENGRLIGCVHIISDITERKGTEKALEESEERFRLAFENANIGMCMVDLQGRLTRVNRQMCEIFGYSHEELEGMTVNDIAHPEDLNISPAFIQRTTSGEIEQASFEKRYFHKEGHIVWGQVSSSLVRDAQGVPQYFISHVQNITERKRAEEALRESEERYRTIMEQSPDGIYLVDVETRQIVEGNVAFQRMLGYSYPEILGLSFQDFVVADREDLERRFTDVLMGKGPFTFERKCRRKDGSLLDVWVSTKVISFGERKVVLILLRDLTEHKQVEEALKESEARYRAVMEQSPDGIFLEDVETRSTLEANAAFQELLGYSSEEIRGLSIYDIVAADRDGMDQRFKKILRSKNPFTHERRYRRKDGSLVEVWLSSKIISYAGRSVTCTLVRDLTERKHIEDQLGKSHQQLRALSARLQAIREEERTRIAREIHDELGGALTGLRMDLSWLAKKLPEDQKPMIEKTASMSNLVDITIQTVRRISSELRPGVLDDLGLIAAIEWQAHDFQNRSGISCEFNSSLEGVDSESLSQESSTAVFRILQEALTNAARHAKATRLTISLEKDADNLILIVEDNGRGISESKISDPKSFGLLGMRERALLLGGNVEVSGTPEKGTIVTASIPLK